MSTHIGLEEVVHIEKRSEHFLNVFCWNVVFALLLPFVCRFVCCVSPGGDDDDHEIDDDEDYDAGGVGASPGDSSDSVKQMPPHLGATRGLWAV